MLSAPIVVVIAELIAADDAKVLAYQLIHGPNESRLDPEVQQSFIDARRETEMPVEGEQQEENNDLKEQIVVLRNEL